jgi:hypothetical protein
MRSAATHSVYSPAPPARGSRRLSFRLAIVITTKRVDQRTIVWEVIVSPRTAPATSSVSFQMPIRDSSRHRIVTGRAVKFSDEAPRRSPAHWFPLQIIQS